VIETDLKLGPVANVTELITDGVTSRSTVLMILDKLYNVFKNSPINEVDLFVEKEDTQIEKTSQQKRKLYHDDQVVMRKQDEERFNANKRNSLKHISVNGIAQMLKSKLEQAVIGEVSSSAGPPPMVTLTTNSVFRSTIEASSRPKSVQPVALNGYAERSRESKYLVASICYECGESVSIRERQNVMHLVIHTYCFRCYDCKRKLDASSYEHVYDSVTRKCKLGGRGDLIV